VFGAHPGGRAARQQTCNRDRAEAAVQRQLFQFVSPLPSN
jgi:hypothetical protein